MEEKMIKKSKGAELMCLMLHSKSQMCSPNGCEHLGYLSDSSPGDVQSV